MNLIKVKNQILAQGEVCDHCLGRQFSLVFKNRTAVQVGAAIRKAKSKKEITQNLSKKRKYYETEKCIICNGLFLKMDSLFDKIVEKANEYEFNTFLIGCSIPKQIESREEELWAKLGTAEQCEPIKRELNKTLGLKLLELTKKQPNFENPDIIFIADFIRNRIFTQLTSLFIYGNYKKLIRGIPQTKWPCSKCAGRGCKACKGTGKQYKETVEELIAEKPLQATKSRKEKFHGEGREDIDARMLGTGRPFVLELMDPVKRDIDLKKLEKQINKTCKGKVEVSHLRFSDKKEVRLLKKRTHEKTYDCLIDCKKNITEKALKELEEYFKQREISQKTPTRVLHRRADKIRKRVVKKVKTKLISKRQFRAEITAEAGTYIKELISGDSERSKPSFTSMLKNKCECKELDVTAIHELKPL